MTDLLTRGITRETMTPDPVKRRKLLVVRLEQGGRIVKIKAKGDRQWYTVTYEQLYRIGCHNRAAAIKAEKEAARQARKAARA